MDEEEVRSALEAAKAAWGDGFQVHLTGGEPFLRRCTTRFYLIDWNGWLR
jgi:molybdenum cofactor biosynthesis enzyme MoaA